MDGTHQSFPAQAFHPDLGNEVVEGSVRFLGWTLRFEGLGACYEIPLKRLAVDLGKGEDDRLFFRDPQQSGLRIIADGSLLEYRGLPQVDQIREQLSARLSRQEILRRVKIVAWVLVACALISWLGMLATGAMVRSIVARVPPEWERQMGGKALEEMSGEMTFLNDTNRLAHLQTVAWPLLRALPGGEGAYQFHIVEDEDPNAFALPGGHILVTTGELELADRPEELLGTIAHEVAHMTQKHALRSVISAGGPLFIMEVFFGGGSGALGALGGTSAFLVSQSFSQEYEMEADDVGWNYLVAANIDPRGMIENFRKTRAYEKQKIQIALVPQAFSSHPSLDKRIARLEARWRRFPGKSRFESPKPDGPN